MSDPTLEPVPDPEVPDTPPTDPMPAPPTGLPVDADPVIGSVVADDWGRVVHPLDPGAAGDVLERPAVSTDELTEADIEALA